MTRIIRIFVLLVALGSGAGCVGAGCDEPQDPCDALAARICEGRDPVYCLRVGAFLDQELTGAAGRPLTGRSRREGCRLILDDRQVLGAYTREAARRIAVGRR